MSNFLISSSTSNSVSKAILNPRLAINFNHNNPKHHHSLKCNLLNQTFKRKNIRLKSSTDEDPESNLKDISTPAVTTKTTESNDNTQKEEDSEKLNYIKVLNLEELPKGERREVTVNGNLILIFWYRNEILACEARSPAEGVYSVGFKEARFTEDYGIVCPTTDTVFSLKTGHN